MNLPSFSVLTLPTQQRESGKRFYG
jgi:hypothetical protein